MWPVPVSVTGPKERVDAAGMVQTVASGSLAADRKTPNQPASLAACETQI